VDTPVFIFAKTQHDVKRSRNQPYACRSKHFCAVLYPHWQVPNQIVVKMQRRPVSAVLPINVLAIAGSDSGGAAGIQADLKTFAAMNAHGLSAVTALTAQNLQGVASVHTVPARVVAKQIDTAFAGFAIGAVKIGMLGSAANVAAVAATLRRARTHNVVLDPVLASSSGTALLTRRGLALLREELIPQADLLTPNMPEAEILLGRRLRAADASAAARELLTLGARAVLLKGGHARGRAVRDFLADAGGVCEISHPRLKLRARGTGCVLSSAVAVGLAHGQSLHAAVTNAEAFLQRVLRRAYYPGRRAIAVLRPSP
jgi:hydroxymethylpyrimidine/phosphomethylpyrimidine kinase